MGLISRSESQISALTGWRRYGLAKAAGAGLVLAMPPVGFFPAVFVSVPILIWLARSCTTRKQSFLTGWAFGAAFFIFGLYWISAALFVDIALWGWVLPLSLILGPAILGLYYGFITLLAHPLRSRVAAHAIAIVAAWALIEYLRGHLLTGFPWNIPGYAWSRALPVMQLSSVVGVYGLTLATLFWAAYPAYRHHRPTVAAAAISLLVVLIGGIVRVQNNPTVQNADYTVRIVQPNIPQDVKWNQEQQWENIEKHTKLSHKDEPASFVIWPESAVPTDLVMFPEIANYIGINLPKGSHAILGNLRVTQDAAGRDQYHNSISLMTTKGKVLADYDKFHLVPFGEYIPFRNVLNITPIAVAISNIGDFNKGDGLKTVRVDGLPAFSPLVCYEVIFPHAAVDEKDRPDWIVNATNDGWYGETFGPYQHVQIARMRAIEEGLPLARAANTGISAVIDPVGRMIAVLPLASEGTLDSILPAPLPVTIYARLGDLLFWLLLALCTAGAVTPFLRKKQ